MTKTFNQYIPFARKYRPTNFDELVGQDVLTKVLIYSILKDRISQGYLLSGIRGVGKTTSARIIAKTINCNNKIVIDETVKPCENCQNCISFNKNNHPDIIEVDAASKTSVDDVRKIIESSEYKPLVGKYTIFIIDEVHMLSKCAFNALLKILEEPPRHIIFIFATTEIQKIPLTVISRCQRYDLRRLTVEEIFKLLQSIAKSEQLQVEIDALRIIASKSDGSARDAISVLDQAASLASGGTITASNICQILGLVDTANIIQFFEYIIDKEANKSIELVNHLYNLSANLELFISLVSEFVAYLTKAKILPGYQDPVYSSFSDRITAILTKITLSQLSIIWQIYSKGIIEMKTTHNQLMEAEMLVIKSIYSQMLPLPEELTDLYSYNNATLTSSECPIANQSSENITDYNQIISFLEFLHAHKEIEVYYRLLNQVEIRTFSFPTMEIAGNDLNGKIKEQIVNLLFAWSGKTWNVVTIKQQNIISFKKQLMSSVKTSEDWEMLTKHFPNVDISDILLKT